MGCKSAGKIIMPYFSCPNLSFRDKKDKKGDRSALIRKSPSHW